MVIESFTKGDDAAATADAVAAAAIRAVEESSVFQSFKRGLLRCRLEQMVDKRAKRRKIYAREKAQRAKKAADAAEATAAAATAAAAEATAAATVAKARARAAALDDEDENGNEGAPAAENATLQNNAWL